jgi:tetratricopeptide (TPR) repeat protein
MIVTRLSGGSQDPLGSENRIRLTDPLQTTTIASRSEPGDPEGGAGEFISGIVYIMKNRKYIFSLVGLILGIAVSFPMTRSFNDNNMKPAAAGAPGMAQPPGASGGAGDQQRMMGDIAKTLETAKNNPKDFEAQIAAARAYYQISKLDETAEYLERAYAADPAKTAEQGALNFLGQHAYEKKNYAEAEKWLRLALPAEAEGANKAEIYVLLAKTFMQREPAQPDKAVAELRNGLKLAPKDAHAVGHLVEAYALKKDAPSAEEALSQLKGLEPASPRIPVLQNLIADVKAGKSITLPKE